MGNALTKRVIYNCPRCGEEKRAWALVKGVPCLKCTGNLHLQAKYETLMWRVSDGLEPVTPMELWDKIEVGDQQQAVKSYWGSVKTIHRNIMHNPWALLWMLMGYRGRGPDDDNDNDNDNDNNADTESLGEPGSLQWETNSVATWTDDVKWEGTMYGDKVPTKDEAVVLVAQGREGVDRNLTHCRKCQEPVRPFKRNSQNRKDRVYLRVTWTQLNDEAFAHCSCKVRNLCIWKKNEWKSKHAYDAVQGKKRKGNPDAEDLNPIQVVF